MTRSKFRRFWLISLGVMMAASMYSHTKFEETEVDIGRKTKHLERLTIERRSGRQITSYLADLASRTIDEKNSTRLDILRYLGLEESILEVKIGASVSKKIAKTDIVTRKLTITGDLGYEEALNQLDYFYNTKKISINYIKILPLKSAYGDIVSFTVGGTIYGLNKSKKRKR